MGNWYLDGLRFTCTMCGNCCTGQPGHIWVSPDEEQEIARHLSLSLEKFRKRYTRRVGDKLSLLEKPNNDCIFLTDDRRCAIHSVKPRQCLTFPFWGRHTESEETWEQAGIRCPGIGTGELHTADEVEAVTDPETSREQLWDLMKKKRPE